MIFMARIAKEIRIGAQSSLRETADEKYAGLPSICFDVSLPLFSLFFLAGHDRNEGRPKCLDHLTAKRTTICGVDMFGMNLPFTALLTPFGRKKPACTGRETAGRS